MNKLIVALMCMVSSVSIFAADNVVTNVYDFKASLKIPYLNNGIRDYKNQSFRGYLYAEYSTNGISDIWIELSNKKTKVTHLMVANENFYHLMGKSSKYSERTIPSVYFEAADIANSDESHEFISKIQFAGTGKLKNIKSVTKGCTPCGETMNTTEYCNILYKMNGSATGVVNCICPEDESWWHTVKATLCGVFFDDNDNVMRTHDASTWGTWSATFNKNLSDTNIK